MTLNVCHPCSLLKNSLANKVTIIEEASTIKSGSTAHHHKNQNIQKSVLSDLSWRSMVALNSREGKKVGRLPRHAGGQK
jgi:hypothetical protein